MPSLIKPVKPCISLEMQCYFQIYFRRTFIHHLCVILIFQFSLSFWYGTLMILILFLNVPRTSFLFRYDGVYTSGDYSHCKQSLLLRIPKRREQALACRTLCRWQDEWGESMGKSLDCGFCRWKCTRQHRQAEQTEVWVVGKISMGWAIGWSLVV